MAKNLDVINLFDIYGEMLTQKQQDFICYYYNDDLSLAEIAENEGITRQGVRDAIKRAEAQLLSFEEHLGLYERNEALKSGLEEISELIKLIDEVNRKTILSRDINDATSRISTLTQMLSE
jgi:predicted DNA-binding protein YlxM (UPF0122 family)